MSDLSTQEDLIRSGGGESAINRQREKGRLTARERVAKLVLSNTAPRIGSAETWNARIEKVRSEGMAAIAPAVVERWFTPEFRERQPAVVAGARRIIVLMEHNDKAGGAKFKKACSLPLTGKNAVDVIITDLAVFERPDRHAPFRLIELAPGVSADEVRAKTTARFLF